MAQPTYSSIYPTCEFRGQVEIDGIEIDGFVEICDKRSDREEEGVFSCAKKHCPKILLPRMTM